ncbi:MAG TPA: hypothetical protein VML75_08460 [Kofleriaceae bacterium]|nr:hypothetical protein [Kofleriaceae bacterium]
MTTRKFLFPVLLMLGALVAAPACGKKTKSNERRAYTVRGEVAKLPPPRGTEIYIHHEAMPEFVNAFGEASGMHSMSMGFALQDVSIEGLAVGDKVEIGFVTDWDHKPALRLTKLTRLPPETELTLE